MLEEPATPHVSHWLSSQVILYAMLLLNRHKSIFTEQRLTSNTEKNSNMFSMHIFPHYLTKNMFVFGFPRLPNSSSKS